MQTLVLFVALTINQPASAPPPNAPPVRTPKVAEVVQPPRSEYPSYSDPIYFPAVVFIGTKPREVGGLTSCVEPLGFSGETRPSVAVFYKRGESGLRFDPGISDDAIRAAAKSLAPGKEQPTRAIPFSPRQLRVGEVAAADGDEDISGQLTFLKDLEPYTTAQNTQHTQRRDVGYIEAVPRSTLKAEWLVPGGLEHARGWKSRLLKNRTAVATVFLDRPDGDAVLWSRSYPNGSVFADVISNAKGKVVEVRVAEKRDGVWDRFVAFKNHAQAPPGFRKFRSSECAICHNQAGHAAYGAGAIPGADGILSDPIPVVEAGGSHQDGRGTQSIR